MQSDFLGLKPSPSAATPLRLHPHTLFHYVASSRSKSRTQTLSPPFSDRELFTGFYLLLRLVILRSLCPQQPSPVTQRLSKGVEKTKDAIKVLKQVGAFPDVEKAKDSHSIRPGKGKMRNRQYVFCKGPLIVYGTEGTKAMKAFRNIPGVEVANVERLNLLKLAPSGHLGRFVIWTKSAFEKLDSVYGSFDKPSEKKKGYLLPRSKMVNSDLAGSSTLMRFSLS